MTDTLAPRAILGVMTPAMNTVVQPELELLRPDGVTNQMQRFRLGGDNISDDLNDEADKLLDCKPLAIAVGLTTDAGPGGVTKLSALCNALQERINIPVCNASIATHAAIKAFGATRIAVMTPFNAETDAIVQANFEAAGFTVAAIKGAEAPTLPAICETPLIKIKQLAEQLAASDCELIAQVGTALPVVGLLDELESITGKPVVACNAAVYWQALRSVGITDSISNYGRLLQEH